ncbi:MAG: RpiB/LacA/LacB family sugar-phosphate isomerase [Candidatus Marsarchaeota archaeon]|nr:RpiB/LacA/LacB family sugar-phosphate isomerase [Candidatus Marsarchaeota archaeon]
MKIFIAADHAGFYLKEKIKQKLSKNNSVVDCGAFVFDSKDDYPDFINKVGKAVSEGEGKGIVLGGSGVGECMVVNKFKKVRGALVFNEYTARKSREHNDSNVLCLGARTISERKALKLVEVWLSTTFKKGRHSRRLKKLREIEKRNFK